MSLDVWLISGREKCSTCDGVGIVEEEAFSYNITHNLNKMAEEVGIYKHLWRPEELGFVCARELVVPLSSGLTLLKSDPEKYKKLNPENGWGSYDALVDFVSQYIEACIDNPSSLIGISR